MAIAKYMVEILELRLKYKKGINKSISSLILKIK